MPETIVGRDEELAAVRKFLESLAGGSAALVVEGEAGIGKTTVWRAGVEEAERRGFRVLTASPVEAETKLSFAGLGDLLGEVVADVAPKLPLPQRRALEVALLIEDAEGQSPDPRTIAVAVANTLGVLAARSPVLVAVDDVQWLDPPTTSALAFAARRLRDDRVGILLAQRTDAADVPLGLRAPATVSVGPLSLGAVHRLLSDRLGVVFPRPVTLKLHEASGGNPFFALELARAVERRGVPLAAGEPLPVPRNLHDLLRDRLAVVSEKAGETLVAAAALAQPTAALISAFAGDSATAQLDAAVDADLIDIRDGRIRFVHPLLASAVYTTARRSQRRDVHRRLALLVDDPEERARHLALAAEGPDEVVASALEHAATKAEARGALAVAAELAEQALALTLRDRPKDSHRRCLHAAENHYASGNATRARLLLEEALKSAPPGSLRAELLWALGRICTLAEDIRTGVELYGRALAEPGLEDQLRARILVSLASFQSAGEDQAREYAREAAALAERLNDPETLARALAALADIAVSSGESLDIALVERVLALEGSPGEFGVAGPTRLSAETLLYVGELDRARPLLERLCEVGRARGDMAVSEPLVMLTQVELLAGNWAKAEQLAQEAYELAEQGERKVDIARGLTHLGYVAAVHGEEKRARELVHDALALTQARGLQSRGPRWVLGTLELSLGRYDAAYEALLPAVERNRELGVRVPFQQAVDAVEALIGMGRIEEARELLAEFEAQATKMKLRWAIARAARASGLVAAAEGDLHRSEELLSDALVKAESLGWRPEVGRTLLALGQVQRRAKRRKAARETLNRALASFEELGAALWAERVRDELGRIAGRKPSEGVLTTAERRVAELAAQGRSNKEVAAALVVSPKTVDVTLTRVYAKLGIHSRMELAGLLAADKDAAKL